MYNTAVYTLVNGDMAHLKQQKSEQLIQPSSTSSKCQHAAMLYQLVLIFAFLHRIPHFSKYKSIGKPVVCNCVNCVKFGLLSEDQILLDVGNYRVNSQPVNQLSNSITEMY